MGSYLTLFTKKNSLTLLMLTGQDNTVLKNVLAITTKAKVDPPESAYCTQPLQQFIKYKRVKMTIKLTPARNWSTWILQNTSANNKTFMSKETSNHQASVQQCLLCPISL